MIISEKQIMQLITIARTSVFHYSNCLGSENWNQWIKEICQLLDVIENQQSEKLKVIE